MTITNSTIARNGAGQGYGGGVLGNDTTRILNSTIVANGASNPVGVPGGGVHGAVLQNTILAHNIYNGAPSDCVGTISFGHNLIGDPEGCNMTRLPAT